MIISHDNLVSIYIAKTSGSAKSGEISWRKAWDEAWPRNIDDDDDPRGFDQGLVAGVGTVSADLINGVGLSFETYARGKIVFLETHASTLSLCVSAKSRDFAFISCCLGTCPAMLYFVSKGLDLPAITRWRYRVLQ